MRRLTHDGSIDLVLPALVTVGVLVLGRLFVNEPLGLALWCVIVAWMLVPTMLEGSRIRASRYLVAAIIATLAAWILAGVVPAILVAAVAFSLLGNVWLLVALRIPAAFAVGGTMLVTGLAFTWPIWAATWLTRVNPEPWLQWLVNVSPAFALNAAISPEDPLTHRPIAYRLMNLGQDVMYAMPASTWPCVLLHGGVGVVGLLSRRVCRPAGEVVTEPITPD